jgi:diaminopimelate epimerase
VIIQFNKYQGTGNDFIIFDARNSKFPAPSSENISTLCDRRFGIGADGLILIRTHSELDFTMKYYNSDGKEGSMCGNGGRCAVAFAKKAGIINDYARFQAYDGIHEGWIRKNIVKITMLPVSGIKKCTDHYELNTGSPHYVKFVDDAMKIDIRNDGSAIRYSSPYGKNGINVNFVSTYKNGILVRTYERGVEDETLSCGTGMVASAICAAIDSKSDKNSYAIYTRGGTVKIFFQRNGADNFDNIILEGPVGFVFEGKIKID